MFFCHTDRCRNVPPGAPGGRRRPWRTNFLVTEPVDTKLGIHIQNPKGRNSCNKVPPRGTPPVPLGGQDPPAEAPDAQAILPNRWGRMRCHRKETGLEMFFCKTDRRRNVPPGAPGGRKRPWGTNFLVTEPVETRLGIHIHNPEGRNSCN